MNNITFLAQAQASNFMSPTSAASVGLTAAVALTLIIIMLVLSVASYVLYGYCLMRIFKKAHIPETWAAWVPVYNTWKLLEIGGQPGYWSILGLIPLVNIVSFVYLYIALYHIGLKLGQSGAFVALAIFFPYIWLIWLAFDKSAWNDSLGAPSLARHHA